MSIVKLKKSDLKNNGKTTSTEDNRWKKENMRTHNNNTTKTPFLLFFGLTFFYGAGGVVRFVKGCASENVETQEKEYSSNKP